MVTEYALFFLAIMLPKGKINLLEQEISELKSERKATRKQLVRVIGEIVPILQEDGEQGA